jgi:uncharacterized phiE125 gp8 family phage protein
MGLKLITAPAGEPISLDEAKTHLRVTHDDDDVLIDLAIRAAIKSAESQTRRALVTQTWELMLDRFPQHGAAINIAKPPLQSVSFIKYIDIDGVLQTWAAENYKVDTVTEPGRIVPSYGKCWPCTRSEINAITIRFVCGYGEEDAIPEDICSWMLLKIGALYEHKEEIAYGQVSELPKSFVDCLLDPYRVYTIC